MTDNYNVYVGSAGKFSFGPWTCLTRNAVTIVAGPGQSVPPNISTSTKQLSSTYLPSVMPTTSLVMASTKQQSATLTSTRTTLSSVSTPTQVPTSSGGSWTYIGCVAEGTTGNRRALTGTSFSKSDMTPEKCQTLCAGYTFAGVEFGYVFRAILVSFLISCLTVVLRRECMR
jgi:glucan endo-1,3-alpha-glucosidase